jgi:lysyl-tRNA synthetase class I
MNDPTKGEDIPYCPICESIKIDITDVQKIKKHTYMDYRCLECGHEWTDAPDEDFLPGGHDDY